MTKIIRREEHSRSAGVGGRADELEGLDGAGRKAGVVPGEGEEASLGHRAVVEPEAMSGEPLAAVGFTCQRA